MKDNKYPVGAKWEAINAKGKKVSYWLEARNKNGVETWYWYAGPKPFDNDWARAKETCAKFCREYLEPGVRLKRVK